MCDKNVILIIKYKVEPGKSGNKNSPNFTAHKKLLAKLRSPIRLQIVESIHYKIGELLEK